MGQIKAIPIERVKSISKNEFIKNYNKPQRPVLIENFSRDWGAFKKWSLEYFQEQAGNQIVLLYNSESTKGKQNSAAPVTEMKFYDYFEKIPAVQNLEGLAAEMKHGDALFMPGGYWHYIKYLDGGLSITLRALPRKPIRFTKMLVNVFIKRHTENLFRKLWGQKWVDYKEALILKKTNRRFRKYNNG